MGLLLQIAPPAGSSFFRDHFSNPLSPMQWAILAGVPVGIIALYFLKLRRRPVQVSSTLLWRRSLEDLHVNSLFQRLRKNLLLFLQLLLVFLGMLALTGPRTNGTKTSENRYILAIDESASMAATDVSPTRLDKAKAEAKKIIDNMQDDDLTMIIAFSDRARVVSNYTSNRELLRAKLASIVPTQNRTSIREALQIIAGLANPASDRTARDADEGKIIRNETIAPKLSIFTDGGFPDPEGLSVGKVDLELVVIGASPPPSLFQNLKPGEKKPVVPSDNLAILALSAARDEEKPDQFQVFGRIRNYRGEETKTEARLFRRDPKKPNESGTLLDAISLTIGPQSEQSFKFDLNDNGLAELEVRLDVKDDLPLDNRAFTVFGTPRKAQVLLVTSKNRYLSDSLKTLAELSDVVEQTPEQAATEVSRREVGSGRYDLVIYDGVRPEVPPEANALYFGVLPPGKVYDKPKVLDGPVILDVDVAHPIMQYVRDLSTVIVQKGVTCELPSGASALIESNGGPLAFVAPRSGFVDAVIGFNLLDGTKFNTNWQLKTSFPLFLYNTLRTLGNARETSGAEVHQPDQPVVIRADSQAATVDVTGPDGKPVETLKRTAQGTFFFNGAHKTGLYETKWGEQEAASFAVNLFDDRESDLAPRGLVPEGLSEKEAEQYKIKIGLDSVKGTKSTVASLKDYWWPIAAAMLVVALVEWYIYNRRVYI